MGSIHDKANALGNWLAIWAAGAAMVIAGGVRLARSQEIKYSADLNAEKRMTVLLKDYALSSMLHLAVREVPRAKFAVIDVHNHVNDAGGIHSAEVPAADVVKIMDRANVKKVVILTGMWGEKLQEVLDKMMKPYPDRFVVFTQVDWSKIDDPQFSAKIVEQLDDAVRRGARGLKVMKDLGLGVKDKSGKLVAIDVVLEKVYHANAERIFAEFKGLSGSRDNKP
jgi:hypothetical protein